MSDQHPSSVCDKLCNYCRVTRGRKDESWHLSEASCLAFGAIQDTTKHQFPKSPASQVTYGIKMQSIFRARPVLRQTTFQLRLPYRNYASAAAPSPSAPPSPALLLKLREDLKTAMRAKDTVRLNVLRGVLAEVTNAAKTSTPIKTDMQLLSLLRKRTSAAEQAGKEFADAGRPELKEKEDAQIEVLQGYMGQVDTVGEQEIRNIVVQAVKVLEGEEKKYNQGDVMKLLVGPGGAFDGKNVEKASVARIVKEVLSK